MTQAHTTGVPSDLTSLRTRLAGHHPTKVSDPRRASGWQAATAIAITPGQTGLQLAVIERVERRGDRWSGQMALPGGRRDPTDHDLAATAVRETHEEVGLPLGAPLARLDDHRGRTRPGIVASYVFEVDGPPELQPDPAEVADAWWLPLADLFDPDRAVHLRTHGLRMPGIEHRGRVIWGLTRNTLETFARALGTALPAP